MTLRIQLPALQSARTAAKSTICLSNQRQLVVGVYSYAMDHDGGIPRGPDALFAPGVTWGGFSHNLIWLPNTMIPGGAYTAHGVLLNGYIDEPRIMTCPGAPSVKVSPEILEDVGSQIDWVLVAYMYRNLDQTSRDQIDDLGLNDDGGQAKTLVFDLQQDIPAGNVMGVEAQRNVNHDGNMTNAAYVDGHAKSYRHTDEGFMLRQSDYSVSLSGLLNRVDELLIRFDTRDDAS